MLRALFFIFSVFIVFTNVFALGDNALGNSSIPLPEKNFSVYLTDSQDITTKAKRVTWNAKTYIQGKYGKAIITIPFEKISKITLSSEQSISDNDLTVQILLKSKKTIQVYLPQTSKAYGQTDFGNFEIYIRDLKTIEFIE